MLANQINQAPLDAWTPVHALTGLGVGLLGLSTPVALGGAVVYEIIEYAHEWPRGSVLFGSKRPESIQNVMTDLLLYGGAYWLGRELARDPAQPSEVRRRIPAGLAVLGLAGILAYNLIPRS